MFPSIKKIKNKNLQIQHEKHESLTKNTKNTEKNSTIKSRKMRLQNHIHWILFLMAYDYCHTL